MPVNDGVAGPRAISVAAIVFGSIVTTTAARASDAGFRFRSPTACRFVVDHARGDQAVVGSPANVIRAEFLELRGAERFVRALRAKTMMRLVVVEAT